MSELRRTGIDAIGEVPWATHFCQFYQTKQDLIDTLVPYFKAGLESNEYCMWITSEPLTVQEAHQAMAEAIPDFPQLVAKGQMEILAHTDWYLKGGTFNLQRVLKGWVDKLNQALARGYTGLRLTGNTAWLEKKDWNDFTEYEAAINGVIGNHKMLALCTYSLDKCNAAEVMDVIRNHEFALIRQAGQWELVENAIYKQSKQALAQSEERFRTIYEDSPIGIEFYDGEGSLIGANRACLDIFGISDVNEVKGFKLFEDPNVTDEVKSRLANGEIVEYEAPFDFDKVKQYKLYPTSKEGVIHLDVSITPIRGRIQDPPSGYMIQLQDITERKQAEEAIRHQNSVLEAINSVLREALTCETEEDLGRICLAIAEHLTGSKFGFVGAINSEGRLDDIAISDPGWDACQMVEPVGHGKLPSDLEVHGIYGRVIQDNKGFFTNEPATHPDSIEVPQGHPLIKAFLGVPLLRDNKTIGMVALANREGGYRTEDLDAMEALAPVIVQVLMRKRAEGALRRIEWLLTRHEDLEERHARREKVTARSYGDLTQLNRSRLILDSVGQDVLADIVGDYLDILGTSAAVYEKDGDYALGIFTSGWCQFMDLASRNLCGTVGNQEALACGKWLCHESCWTKASRSSIETDQPTDIECEGGIHLYAVPISAGGGIIGSINIGYGDPPRDPIKRRELAAKYHVSVEELNRQAEAYETRPPYIIELAKQRLQASARLIGEIVDRKQAEEKLRESEERLKRAQEIGHLGSWELDLLSNRLTWSDEVYLIFGLQPQEFGATYEAFLERVHPDDRNAVDSAYSSSLRDNRSTYDIEHRVIRKDTGEIRVVHERCEHFRDATGNIIRSVGMVHDITERKKAEEQLRETRDYLDNLLDYANAPIIVWDPSFRITRFNHAFERLTGRKAEGVLGEKLNILFPDDTREESLNCMRRALAGERWEAVEIPILRTDGEVRTALWNSANILGTDGTTVIATIAQGQDITERKRAEESLKFRERMLQRMTDLSPAMFSITDLVQGREIYSSKSVFALLGYKPEEIQDPLAFAKSITHAEDYDRMLMAGAELLKAMDDQPRRTEVRFRDARGQWRWLQIIYIVFKRDPSGLPVQSLSISVDITERKQAEAQLRETRDYLNNLLDSANAPIMVWDPEFRITKFNHAFEHLTGLKAEQVMGKRFDILFPEDERKDSLSYISRTLAGERWEVVEIPILRSDGKVRTVLWNSANIHSPDGTKIIATIAQGQDITDRKRAAEEVKRLNEALNHRALALEMANKELEGFSYSVSHDLRAPLRSMDGFSLALLEDYGDKLDDQAKDYLQRIRASSQLMEQLIEGILKLSQVARSQISLQEVNLSKIAHSIAVRLQKGEPQRAVQFLISPDIVVNGDAQLLEVVLENLIENAWKFTARQPQARIEFGVEERDCGTTCFIRDNGAGFDPTYAAKLFVPFQRLHTVTDFPGTGIGLATVQRIINRHGGRIWADSEVGRGATFYFTLRDNATDGGGQQ